VSVTAVCFQTFLQESLIGRNVFIVGIGCAERMPLVVEQDIERLETEKAHIESALSSGTISVEQITEMSKRLPRLVEELDEKSMRWLELSEWA
jgi:hypothetical protein